MQHRTKRNHELSKLIRNFEKRIQSGILIYLEEQEIHQLLDYYEQKDMLEYAIYLVEAAISQNPYRSEYHLILSRIYYRINKKEKSLEVIEGALIYACMDYDLLFMKARILIELHEFHEANEILSNLRMRSHGKQKTLFLLLEAYSYELQRDYVNMYKAVKESVIHDPSSSVALRRMWVAVEISKNYRDSIEVHRNILNVDPYNYLAWFNLGHAYICLNEYEHAIMALEYCFVIQPDFEAAYSDCADICEQVGRFPQALEIQLNQLEKFGLNSDLLVKIAENLLVLHRPADAKKHLNKARILDPYNDEVFYNLGKVYADEGNYLKTITLLLKAIRIEKRREEYYGLLADAYLHSGFFSKADYYYRRATETGPENPIYWLKHVTFLFNIGEFSQALEVINEANTFTYSNDLNCAEVAILYYIDSRDNAISHLEKLLSDEDFSPQYLFNLVPELKEDRTVLSMLSYYKF